MKPHVGMESCQWAIAKGGHSFIEDLTDAGDLSLADPFQAHALDQIVNLPGTGAKHMRFLNHRMEGLLHPAPGFEEGWEVTPLTQLWILHLNGTYSGIPLTSTIPILVSLPD